MKVGQTQTHKSNKILKLKWVSVESTRSTPFKTTYHNIHKVTIHTVGQKKKLKKDLNQLTSYFYAIKHSTKPNQTKTHFLQAQYTSGTLTNLQADIKTESLPPGVTDA